MPQDIFQKVFKTQIRLTRQSSCFALQCLLERIHRLAAGLHGCLAANTALVDGTAACSSGLSCLKNRAGRAVRLLAPRGDTALLVLAALTTSPAGAAPAGTPIIRGLAGAAPTATTGSTRALPLADPDADVPTAELAASDLSRLPASFILSAIPVRSV